jgi:hypothetical protein
MRPSLLLLLAILAGCTHPSGQGCSSVQPESFRPFLVRFLADKQFAMSRTVYPLLTVNHGAGDDGSDVVTKTYSTREQDSKSPAINGYMKENGLVHEVKSTNESTALVTINKPDTDWLYDLHYTRKNGCWMLTEIQDYSL